MKRYLVLILALMLTFAFVSCDSNELEPATTEAQTTEAPTEAPTDAPTEAPTEDDVTVPEATEEATTEWQEPEDVPYEPVVNPVMKTNEGKELEGYHANGEFNFEEGDALSVSENNMFIVTNDRMASGKITATFSAPDQHNNDNGIIFGMTNDVYEQYYFWEDGPTYYFLFVSDDATLYLAKVSYNGQPWTELQITAPIPNYKHGDVITISVEFDGEGAIDCYANGEWLINYYDYNWVYGSRYGIRCEVPGVCYTDVLADHSFVYEW